MLDGDDQEAAAAGTGAGGVDFRCASRSPAVPAYGSVSV